MLWIKAFHIIFVITWFAGLFYLPRLFVYHAMAEDEVSRQRFCVMERKLYYGIMTPTAILATGFGIWMVVLNPLYLQMLWLQIKLGLVVVLWIYHLACNHYRKQFLHNTNRHSHVFYRWFNEVSVVILIAVVILAVVKPG